MQGKQLEADGNGRPRCVIFGKRNRSRWESEGKTCACRREKGLQRNGAAAEGRAARPRSIFRPRQPPRPPPSATRRLRGHSPYLLCGDHGDHVCSLLPHHLPEVVARVWQGPLGGYVVPFRPTDHHLETKESTGERTPNPGRNFLLTMGPFLIHLKTLDNIFLAKLVSATLNAEG